MNIQEMRRKLSARSRLDADFINSANKQILFYFDVSNRHVWKEQRAKALEQLHRAIDRLKRQDEEIQALDAWFIKEQRNA